MKKKGVEKRQPLTERAWQIIYLLFCIGVTGFTLALMYGEYVHYMNH